MAVKVQWRWKLPAIYLVLVAGVGIVLTVLVRRGPTPDELWDLLGPWLSFAGAPWAFFFSHFGVWWLAAALLINTALLHAVGRLLDRGLRLTSA